MEKKNIDKIFQEKLEGTQGLPSGIKWNIRDGWKDYERKYIVRHNPALRILAYVASAAALVAGIFISLELLQRNNNIRTVTNNSDKIREIILPENNRAWLNKNSMIVYPDPVDKDHNTLTITGEAYIEIKNVTGTNYTIKANNAVILVEDKSEFNIRALQDEDNVIITVEKGAVKIREESNDEGLILLVSQGNYCSVHKSQNIAYASANRNYNFLSWKTGKLVFNSMPIATVTDILTRYYHTPVEIEDKTLAYCLFTGTFQNQSIDNILHQIQTDLNCIITNTGNKIVISGKGCHNL